MASKLTDYLDSRDNNFNLLRFGAATAVFISHCPTIAGDGIVPVLTLLAYVAVNSFFIISGFLVSKSLARRRNVFSFVRARALRIYPALLLAVAYTVFVGAIFSDLPTAQFLSNDLTQAYWLKNASQLIWPIPEVLPGLAGWGTINAPLWTLPFELHMYLLLLLFGTVGLLLSGWVQKVFWTICFILLAIATGLYVADYAYNYNGYGLGHYRNYIRFIAMFGLGVAAFALRNRIVLNHRYFVIILISIALASPLRILFVAIAYTMLAYVLLYLAYIPAGILRKFNQLGDYSYAIYIFGYPTQKAVMQFLPEINAIQLFLIAFSITLLIAIISWHFIERPALSLKQRWGINRDTSH